MISFEKIYNNKKGETIAQAILLARDLMGKEKRK